MTSLQAWRTAAILAGCLAIVAIQDADALRKQRDAQAASSKVINPALLVPGPAPTVQPDDAAGSSDRAAPAVRYDKLV